MRTFGKIEFYAKIPYILHHQITVLFFINQEMHMRSFAILTLLIFSLSFHAFSGEPVLFRMDDSHSSVTFSLKYLKFVNFEGRFDVVRGAFMVDTSDITKTSFTAIIKTESINTANEGRDEDLRGEDFFDVAKHPAITFQSKRVEKQGDGYVAIGSYTMRGVTKEVALPFTYLGTMVDPRGNVRVGFESKSKLKRSEYGVSGSSMTVDDEVNINLSVLAVRQNPDSARMSFGRKKSIAQAMLETMNSKSLTEAIEQYKTLKADTTYDSGPNQLGILTMRFSEKGKTKDAIEVGKLSVEAYPNDSQQYFRLGYAYQKDGNKAQAKENYKKALELDAFNALAMEMLRWVE
jgi:polyisoprenoid-binding protein YceI